MNSKNTYQSMLNTTSINVDDAEVIAIDCDNATVRETLNLTGCTITGLLINTANLADNSITEAKLANNSVSTAKIQNLAITNAKINDIDASKITGTITNTVNSASISVSSDPVVSLAATQTLTNKTLTNPTITGATLGGNIRDSTTFIINDIDATKRMQFDCSSIGSGHTRTLTAPNTSGTIVLADATQVLTNKTLTSPIIALINNGGVLTLPPSTTDRLVGRATTDTLTNKTLTLPIISSISNGGTITIPSGTRQLVARDTVDTLTNKTLTNPIISSISNSGTITLPTGTRTLVARDTTDTLTNKTLVDSSTYFNSSTGVGKIGVFSFANISDNTARYYSFPNYDATVSTVAGIETLTNKTLTSPIISSISNSGILTLPTGSHTLVGRDTTDTLTNKTLTNPTITGATLGGDLQDSTTFIVDNSDASKKLQFECSGITTATTRTLTAPNASGTIVLDSNTQTLSNKSFSTAVNITDATQSVSVLTGSIVSAGGIGVSKNAYFGAQVYTGTTLSAGTTLTAGSDLYVNGELKQCDNVLWRQLPVLVPWAASNRQTWCSTGASKLIGATITDPVAGTGSIAVGDEFVYWYIIGNTLFARYELKKTSGGVGGSNGSGEITVLLPNGYIIDTGLVKASTTAGATSTNNYPCNVGYGIMSDGSNCGDVMLIAHNSTRFRVICRVGAGWNLWSSSYFVFNGALACTLYLQVPIIDASTARFETFSVA